LRPPANADIAAEKGWPARRHTLERSDLKTKHPDIYQRLTGAWDNWNRAMLSETAASYTYNNSAETWADHINTPSIDPHAYDDGSAWPL